MAGKKPKKKALEHEYQATESYDYDIRPGETDLHYYRRLAKTADQRLLRLEALKHDKHFRGAERYAYARAIRDIESYGGKKRFNTKPPEARSLFNGKIADMIRFLKSPTSTKSGIIEVHEKRAKTLSEKYDMDISWEDMANLTESGELDKLKGDYGSDTAFKSIGTITRNRKQIEDAINKAKEKEEKAKENEEEWEEDENDGKKGKPKTLAEQYGIATDSPLDASVESILNNKELMEILLRG